jgi:predicted anti-sigma-YlaC factor YlaD
MKFMLDCRLLARLLSQTSEGTAPLAIRARMGLHLMSCRACRNVDGQMRFVRKAMQALQLDQPVADR